MLNIRTLAVGPVQANCYILSDAMRRCLIVDPGGEGTRIVRDVRKAGFVPEAILLTHAHFDHIEAADVVREAFGIPLYVHPAEKSWLVDPKKNGSAAFRELPDVCVQPAEKMLRPSSEPMELGSFRFRVLHTPGHSPGSVTFAFDDDRFAIVGDTLFREGIGRTDLFQADAAALMRSIEEQLLTLPEETVLFPGHGEATTPVDEMEHNPFLGGWSR